MPQSKNLVGQKYAFTHTLPLDPYLWMVVWTPPELNGFLHLCKKYLQLWLDNKDFCLCFFFFLLFLFKCTKHFNYYIFVYRMGPYSKDPSIAGAMTISPINAALCDHKGWRKYQGNLHIILYGKINLKFFTLCTKYLIKTKHLPF